MPVHNVGQYDQQIDVRVRPVLTSFDGAEHHDLCCITPFKNPRNNIFNPARKEAPVVAGLAIDDFKTRTAHN